MKTVEEIIKPFIKQPYMTTEGHFGVDNKGATRNMLKEAGADKNQILRNIITCNPELRNPENAALLGEVIARVEQEMAITEEKTNTISL